MTDKRKEAIHAACIDWGGLFQEANIMTIHELKLNDGKPDRIRELKRFEDMSLIEMSEWFKDHPEQWDRPLPNGDTKDTATGEIHAPTCRNLRDIPDDLENQRNM